MGAVGDDSGCDNVIVTFQRPSDISFFLLSTVLLSGLKIVTSLFVKSVEQSELHSCSIDMILSLFKFVCGWSFVDSDDNIGRGKCTEIVG